MSADRWIWGHSARKEGWKYYLEHGEFIGSRSLEFGASFGCRYLLYIFTSMYMFYNFTTGAASLKKSAMRAIFRRIMRGDAMPLGARSKRIWNQRKILVLVGVFSIGCAPSCFRGCTGFYGFLRVLRFSNATASKWSKTDTSKFSF